MSVGASESLAANFVKNELEPLQAYGTSDAIDYFVIDAETKKGYLAQAVATGDITGQDYANCVNFRVIDHKKNRYDLKRAEEILKLLRDVAEHADPKDISSEIALEQAKNSVTMAALVEACNKLQHEKDIPEHTRKFYLECLDGAQADLYTPPNVKTAEQILAMLVRKVANVDPDVIAEDVYATIAAFREDYPFVFEADSTKRIESPLSKERVHEFSEEMHSRYDAIFSQLNDEFGEITNDKLVDITNRYLELRGVRSVDPETGIANGWSVEYNEEINGFKCQPKLEKLLCGKFSVSITWQRYQELMQHEVEGHLMRSYNARKKNIQPLAFGLPGYDDAEEGWGLISEQLWKGVISTVLARDHFRYLAIAYGDGKVDGRPHPKEETFDFLSRFMIVADLCKVTADDPADVESVVKHKRKLAFEHVFRAYRGMPEGRVFYKDTSYLVGKLTTLEFLASTDAPAADVLDFMQQGKFDPTNEVHKLVLRRVGLRDSI